MALTKVLANEFARDNILVNALLTGSIVTDQVANRYKREQPSLSFEDYIATIGKGIPIGRMGTAQEYANLACFLASDAGSSVTGTAMHLDSGACPVVCGETGGGRRDAARRVPTVNVLFYTGFGTSENCAATGRN